MMKRIILCMVISMSLCTMLMGQNEQKPTQNYPRQEVSISYGDVLLAISPIYNTQGTSNYPNHNWFAPNTYKGDEVSPGAFSLSYMYGIKKWLWLGVSATYTSFYQNVYDFSHQKVATNSGHKMAIVPTIRFMYVYKENFNLYSAFGIGASFGLYNDKEMDIHNFNMHPVIQFTGIGVSVGKDLRGFAEFGCGPRGVFNCGVQYRFGK